MLYFASDFHLGLYKQEVHKQEQKIIDFLNYAVSNGAKQIFLVGDIFDFWFEYKRAVPKGYFRLFYTFHQIVNSGIKITLFKGNHDMWMFDYLEKECGVEVITAINL
jgi:UDP-2,3-diacylglucosamine hydrolase